MKWEKWISRIVWGLILLIILLVQTWEWLDPPPSEPAPPPEYTVKIQTLRSPRLVTTDGANDGDSFRIAHEGGEHTFRLYFVDCAEKREYRLVAGRLKDQASYFGGLSIPQTLALGQQAREFTEKWLTSGDFQLQTRWEHVFESERYYAYVICHDGEHLGEKLVRAGLARIHGKGSYAPDGSTPNQYELHLKKLEDEARHAHRGAWSTPKRAPPSTKTAGPKQPQ
ncbi:MAG: thermonuclease family protein [Verrucomicrobiaceae bacterium]|nr:thermonuclease family protein [Verrucomicrobiaceae bacterium]